ncbi:DUF4382 domain-containing protein, partial [Halorubrum sp. SS5]
GSTTLTGDFRLLISDAPADIGDFDRLDVTLDRARVFEAQDDGDEDDEAESDGDGGDDDESEENATDADGGDGEPLNGTADQDDGANETADADDDGDESEDGDDSDDGDDADDEDDSDDADEDDSDDGGFIVVDLDGATVDLTRVIEDDAIAVFDGEIPAGSYEKIELDVSAVEGIVDGGEVDVKLPSEKLQITTEFEVTPDEGVDFVFDINVVKRGKNNGYILKPVISGSGVAGRDVDVNEIDDEEGDDEGDDDGEETADGGSDGDGSGGDGSDGGDAPAGNETDDAENGTATGS